MPTRLALLWVLALIPALRAETESAPERMNVVFILADDLGWSDTTLYGTTSLYRTPNMERLRKRGMLFTRAYSNSPLCSPTRASVLTGQTPARHRSTAPQHHLGAVRLSPIAAATGNPGRKQVDLQSVTRLDTRWPTLGKVLSAAGYATGHFGKWHLGLEPYSPLQHGFDVDIPHHPGPGPAGSYVAPWKFKNFKANKPGEHIEDRMAEEATAWIRERAKSDGKPFFLNYWQFSVHAPFDAKASLVKRYESEVRADAAQNSAVYAAMVHSLDDAVGTLVDTLDATGLTERTVIVFTSDNGGNMYSHVPGPSGKPTAPTSNAPLRGGKATIYEGGIRVPCVVVWPGVTEPESTSDEPIQTSDFYPTLLEGLGVGVPEGHVVDGIDIRPALAGGELDRDAIFTYFPHSPPVPDWLPPSVAVHSGKWKLIRMFHEGPTQDGKPAAHAYRLYDLDADIGETNNLAEAHPDIVRRLDAKIQAHLIDAQAITPRKNQAFDPAKYKPEQIGIGRLRSKPVPKPRAKTLPPSATAVMKARDTDGDEALTLKEYIGDPTGRNVPVLTARFKTFDTNGDEKLSLGELRKGQGR